MFKKWKSFSLKNSFPQKYIYNFSTEHAVPEERGLFAIFAVKKSSFEMLHSGFYLFHSAAGRFPALSLLHQAHQVFWWLRKEKMFSKLCKWNFTFSARISHRSSRAANPESANISIGRLTMAWHNASHNVSGAEAVQARLKCTGFLGLAHDLHSEVHKVSNRTVALPKLASIRVDCHLSVHVTHKATPMRTRRTRTAVLAHNRRSSIHSPFIWRVAAFSSLGSRSESGFRPFAPC